MTNNKQQTALEYYSKEIGRLTSDLITGKITGKQFVMLEIQMLEQAKEMEKERMIQFAKQCLDKALDLDVRTTYSQVERYYNETYGGDK